jgi:hypothetical protein
MACKSHSFRLLRIPNHEEKLVYILENLSQSADCPGNLGSRGRLCGGQRCAAPNAPHLQTFLDNPRHYKEAA